MPKDLKYAHDQGVCGDINPDARFSDLQGLRRREAMISATGLIAVAVTGLVCLTSAAVLAAGQTARQGGIKPLI